MNNTLPCAIVRDLLPAYIEGLTEEETSAAVKAHLECCPDCAARYAAMSAPEEAGERQKQEVDFLKTVRRKNRKRVLLAAVLVLALTLGAAGAKTVLIGSPADGQTIAISAAPQADGLTLQFSQLSSAQSLFGWKTERSDGVLRITARQALSTSLHPSGDFSMTLSGLSQQGIREIWAFDRLVWKEGLLIDLKTEALMEAKTPYVGSAPAVGRLADLLLSGFPVGHTLSLDTAQVPYGITLVFSEKLEERDAQALNKPLYLLLALVGNADYVAWTDDDGASLHTLSLEEANAALAKITVEDGGPDWPMKASIKDYSGDVWSLTQLQTLLDDGFFSPSALELTN